MSISQVHAESIDKLVSNTVDVILKNNDKGYYDLVDQIRLNGAGEKQANNLLIFIELAFGRVFIEGVFKNRPAPFTDYYILQKQNGDEVNESFVENAIYQASYELAKKIDAKKTKELGDIAMRSAEFNALNSALNSGSSLEDVEFVHVRLPYELIR